MAITAIVDTQTNEFVVYGHVEDARYVKKIVPRNPDPAVEKYSGDDANPIAAKSSAEIQATADAVLNAQFDLSLSVKDLVATVAWAIQLKDPVAWAAKTNAQKKTQVQSELANWKTIRMFVEKNM